MIEFVIKNSRYRKQQKQKTIETESNRNRKQKKQKTKERENNRNRKTKETDLYDILKQQIF